MSWSTYIANKLIKDIKANKNESESITYEKALTYFGNKLVVDSDEFAKLSQASKAKAFTVARYSEMDILNKFHGELVEAIKQGLTLHDFKTRMNDFLIRKGYEGITPFQADNIYRTNIQTAFNIGRYNEMNKPTITKYRPYWIYDAIDDSHTRASHRAMNNKVFRYDNPVWDTWYPPNGYRCRCKVRTLSERQLKERGLMVSEHLDPVQLDKETGAVVQMLPDKNFGTNPAKTAFKPDIEKFPRTFQKVLSEEMK
ncbi:phage minor head protein [Vallitalea guaymasensis]|uniref:phage head morphogenesis protein n=1 Tax=Vallitalea guaymasensis TaxID=1185412 RepID=UPI000DE4E2E7|nr:phage minor head protein [Vallitalea guaymasensis]